MELLASIASSVFNFLEFTHEVAQENCMIPVLDMQIGVGHRESNGPWFSLKETGDKLAPGVRAPSTEEKETQQIKYHFYSKPMANPLIILARSGIPEGTKIATMTSELRRRWKNTWEGASRETYEGITVQFMDNLTAMGYDLSWRKDVLSKAMVGYMKVLKNVQLGITQRNRTSASTATKRRFDKLCGNNTWYTDEEKEEIERTVENRRFRGPSSKKDNRHIESVMFVPLTPGGALRKNLN